MVYPWLQGAQHNTCIPSVQSNRGDLLEDTFIILCPADVRGRTFSNRESATDLSKHQASTRDLAQTVPLNVRCWSVWSWSLSLSSVRGAGQSDGSLMATWADRCRKIVSELLGSYRVLLSLSTWHHDARTKQRRVRPSSRLRRAAQRGGRESSRVTLRRFPYHRTQNTDTEHNTHTTQHTPHTPHTPHTTHITPPHNTTQHNTTQHNTTQHNTTPHHTTPHHTTPHHTTPHHTTPHTTHITPPHHTTPHNTTQHHTTPHNTTQHNTTQHNTTQHNTTQHYTTQRTSARCPECQDVKFEHTVVNGRSDYDLSSSPNASSSMRWQRQEQCWTKVSWRKREQRQCSRSEKRYVERCSMQRVFTVW